MYLRTVKVTITLTPDPADIVLHFSRLTQNSSQVAGEMAHFHMRTLMENSFQTT